METCADGVPPDDEQLPYAYALFAPATEIAPKICRDFVGNVLALLDLRHLVEAAALCTSELVTNVHRHAKGDVRRTLSVAPTHVLVGAYDDCPELPAPRCPDGDETGGRGLLLVGAVSDGCGVNSDADGGKRLWFRLDVRQEEGERGASR